MATSTSLGSACKPGARTLMVTTENFDPRSGSLVISGYTINFYQSAPYQLTLYSSVPIALPVGAPLVVG